MFSFLHSKLFLSRVHRHIDIILFYYVELELVLVVVLFN